MHRKFYREIDNSTVNPTGNQLKKKKEHTQKTTQRTNRVRKRKKNQQQTETENKNGKNRQAGGKRLNQLCRQMEKSVQRDILKQATK